MYCANCGKEIDDGSILCEQCKNKPEEPIETSTKVDEPQTYSKSKGTAIVLSIFFGVFCWLYTYGKNKYKFWISFIILVLIYTTIFLIKDNLDSIINLFLLLLTNIASIGLWLWGLIYHIAKPDAFFKNYPN